MIKPLLPMVKKFLTEENASQLFENILKSHRIEHDEVRNIITLTKEKNNKVYATISGINAQHKITRVKEVKPLVEFINQLLSSI